jgi:hypothetical protein
MKKSISYVVFAIFLITTVVQDCQSQILYTEGFAWSYDTAKRFHGSISPSFNFQTPKENFIQFMNNADLSIHLGKRELKLANSFQLIKSGSDVILSGGYLYAKLLAVIKRLSNRRFSFSINGERRAELKKSMRQE